MRLMNDRFVIESVDEIVLVSNFAKGGGGSGNWGHAGRPGRRGGSAPGGGHRMLEQQYGVVARGQERIENDPYVGEPEYSLSLYALNQQRELSEDNLAKFGISREDAKKELRAISQEGKPAMRTSVDSLSEMIDSGYISNAFDTNTGTGSGGMMSFRQDVEERGFGVPKELEGSKRPVYGFLKLPGIEGRETVYGGVELEFDDSVLDNATMTMGDSLRATFGVVKGTSVRNPDIECISTVPTGSKNRSSFSSTREFLLNDIEYVEVQFPGRISTKAIKKVTDFGGFLSSRPDFVKRLREIGIKVEGVYE